MVLLATVFAGVSLASPKYAFDTITYLGCTFKAVTGDDWSAVQTRTYAHLKQSFPDRYYREVTESPPGISPYRSLLTSDPEVFRQRLSAACYKVGFVAPMIALTYIGIDPYLAARLLAAVPAALAFGLVGIWLAGAMPAGAAIPVAIVGLLAGLFQTARYEYPDGMTALAVAGALVCFAEAHLRPACLCFLAAMVVRMDAILYFGAFLGVAVFLATGPRRMRFLEAFLWGVAALALYAAISLPLDTPRFEAVFWHSFIAQQPYLLDTEVTVSLGQYLDVMERQVQMVAGKSAKYPLLIACAIAAYVLTFRDQRLRAYGETALASLLMVSFHFLFIPWFDTRYYAAPYMMIVCCLGVVAWHEGVRFARRCFPSGTKG